MAQIALPRHQSVQEPPLPASNTMGAPLYERRPHADIAHVELLPNPDFSFPMRAPDTPSHFQTARRGSMPHQRRSTNLPDFSFNSASLTRPSTGTSPPQSSWGLSPTPARPIHGHRRGGSEFIGGDVRPGGPALMSTSPTKGEDALPPPASLRPGPPAGRRGHAHRRSGAVSSHDLSSIMQPPAPARTGSAPVTPSEGNQFAFGHSFNRSISQPSLREASVNHEDAARPPSRARVGFSERVEYIRPLSTISSETETSLSTFRGHSATNSLSSIVSGSSPQPPRVRSPLSPVEDEGRPSTAGAVLDNYMMSSLNGESSDRKRPMSAVSPVSPTTQTSRTPAKRRGFFRLDSRRCDNLEHTLSTSASDSALSKTVESPLASPTVEDEDTAEEPEKLKPASRKSNRTPRKVKSWANSIIPRKGKHGKKAKARPSTPPADSLPDADDSDASEETEMEFEPNFDEDTTVTIVSPTEPSPPVTKIDTHYASWQPKPLQRVDSDMMSPIIDLDAALGPFKTPNGTSPRNKQRGFAAHRRAMHSANGLPPNHRRTESAPELVPFELRSSAAAAASPMADVFEEEEPEEEGTVLSAHSQPTSIAEESEEPKISVIEADEKQEGDAINWNFSDGLGIKRPERDFEFSGSEPQSPCAVSHTPPAAQQLQKVSDVEVVEDFEEPRTSSLTHSSDSTLTPQPSGDEVKEQQPVMNLSLPLSHQSLMTPDTVTSSFSSPDYRSSQVSFDTPRVGTAASSMSDYPVMPSPRFGEPGPELRVSVDDVPSLTSSRSTMTSALHNAYPFVLPPRPGDRTASLCSDPSELESQRRKRSSIASLSRLINGSSYGERSKLSIEQRPQSQHSEPAKEKKKHNRLSKLKFWKSSRELSTQRI